MNSRFKIGMRNIKTAVAVGICLLVFQLINVGSDINGVQAAVAATICMKSSLQNTIKTGLDRVVGTVIGSVMGVLFLMLHNEIPSTLTALLATLGVVMIIYLCNVLRLWASASISVVVYLIILIGKHDIEPVYYGLARLGETVFGIFVAFIVNKFLDPAVVFRKNKQQSVFEQDAPFMRKYLEADIGGIMQIWLHANILANGSIGERYWHGRYDSARHAIRTAADTTVYIDRGQVRGFISITEESSIIALCVSLEALQTGIGTKLLNAAKSKHPCLSARVYKDNDASVQFLKNRGFYIAGELKDEETGHAMNIMEWSSKNTHYPAY
ncbi:MAG: GNAT family N-acetyltransferase [Christensenellales bacterium]|jgi:ribosomal protein S18 acetylase RimI-like enzyme